jgi:hypothetical protein
MAEKGKGKALPKRNKMFGSETLGKGFEGSFPSKNYMEAQEGKANPETPPEKQDLTFEDKES